MQLVTMEEDKSKEELDDLRKKRLNYFRSIDTLQKKPKSVQDIKDNTKQLHENTSTHNNVVNMDLQKTASDLRKVLDKSITENGIKTSMEFNSCYQNAKARNLLDTSVKHSVSKKQETDADGFSGNDQVSLKASSIDLSSPDGLQKQDEVCVEMKDIHEHLKDSSTGDGLDAYNETVERLIRATKEELLGLKVSDNIWTKFMKDSKSVPETTGEQLALQTHVVPDLHLYEYDSKQTLKTFNDILSERQPYQNNHVEIVHGNTYVNKTFYSNLEPSPNVCQNGQTGRKANFDSSKIEEIFSCRQVHLSITGKNSDDVNVKTKIDLPVHLSQELLDIELSTHRPDSGENENIEAKVLQLEDSVTKELKLVLGEEKFKQFLMKSKRDIDNLHESSSNGSSERQEKTPRLRKQKSAIPFSSVQKSYDSKEHKTTTQTNVKNCSKENYQEPQLPHCILKERTASKIDAGMHHNTSQEFTPRIAVEDMIAEYILHDVKDDTKMTLNRGRSKLNNIDDDLNAEESNKFDSFRSKLHRPKYEPHSIYQDQDGKEKNGMYNTSAELITSKNYEQITVPRNFAFSADEIYNQAYGMSFPVYALSAVQQEHVGDKMQFAQYLDYTNQATLLSAPVPLQSPVAPSHIPHHHRYAQGGIFKGQHSYIYPIDDMNTFRKHPEMVVKRQSSLTNEVQLLPHPPNQSPPQTHAGSHFQQDGANNADLQGYSAHSESRCNGQILGTEQTFHIPHPPADVTSINQNCTPSTAAEYTSGLGVPIGYTYPYQIMMFTSPQQLTNVTTASQKIPTQVLGTTQTLNSIPDKTVVDTCIPLLMPTTAHAEVQTDRDDSPAVQGNEKLVVTPESQISSVYDEEKLIPHPPAVKNEGKSSPRRHHTANIMTTEKVQDPQRHIDGIRQHHQQRKQEEESRQLTDNQILARQRKYAKASLDRYFSSLENVYKSSLTSTSMEMSTNDLVIEAGHDTPNVPESHNAIDNGLNVFFEKDINDAYSRNFGENKYLEEKVSFNFTENNAQDIKTNSEKVSNERKFAPVVKTCLEFDNATTVNSVSNTDMSVKAGGITDRLKEIGINVVHTGQAKREHMLSNKKKEGKKGKVLIICPECKSLNKEYMSWCSQCGEIIIGIEPMIISKSKDGKIRTRPSKTGETSQSISDKQSDITKSNEGFKVEPPNKVVEINNVEELNEKPFLINFDEIKIAEENDGSAYNETRSPMKSDVKDSGKPSRDECDLDPHSQDIDVGTYFQTKKIEEEAVNDRCAKISNPVVKGYLKSHFNKSKCLSVDKDENTEKDHHLDMIDGALYRNQQVGVKINYSDLSNEYQVYSTINETFLNVNENKHLDNGCTNVDDQDNCAPSDNVHAKTCMFDKLKKPDGGQSKKYIFKDTSGTSATYSKSLFIPSPLPSLKTSEPKPLNELALKLPAGSMDYSTDVSFVMSNFDVAHANDNKNDVAHVGDGKIASDKETVDKEKEERKRQRRRKRGHGAIDVEVFGYEETRESRNSSRAVGMVPLLNLTGNSSDEDNSSVKSDTKVKHKLVSQLPHRAVTSAWEPDAIQEESSDDRSTPAVNSEIMVDNLCHRTMQNWVEGSDSLGEHITQSTMQQQMEVPANVAERPGNKTMQQHVGDSYEWKQMFDPQADVQGEVEDETTVDGQPFLEQITQQHAKRQMSKKRPNSGKSKVVKHKVCQSLQQPAYQRKWPKSSSLVRSSFTAGQMNTASTSSSKCPVTSSPTRLDVREVQTSGVQDITRSSPVRPLSAINESSINIKSKKSKGNCKKGIDLDLDTELVTDMVKHRLPKPNMLDRLKDHMASSEMTYDKYLQMTPRINAGTVSIWQCLPDEILLYIFAYLDQGSLTNCAQVCHQFYRVSMDESLWRYVSIKKRDVDNNCLTEIARRHPISLALIQCHGDQVTSKGLRDLFRDCAESLKELNVSRCSGGALNGDSILLHAAARCHHLTHVDTSWCNVTDSGLMAISNTCHRLESLCINGCQAISNDGLETIMKKHGTQLRVLEMFGCINLSPRGLRSVSLNCTNLVTLNLGQCYKITDSCISQLSTSLGKIELLDLRGCKQIKDNCLRRVVKNCPRLQHLSLANCPNITDVSILEISTYLTDIRSLDLCGCKNISDSSIRALVNTCNNLRHLDISSTSCTHRSVSMIANFCHQRLESLKINFLSDVTEQSLIKLVQHCRNLKSVHLYGCTSVRSLDKVREERPSINIET